MSEIKSISTEYNSRMLINVCNQVGEIPILSRETLPIASIIHQVYDILIKSSMYVNENNLLEIRRLSPYSRLKVVGKIKLPDK